MTTKHRSTKNRFAKQDQEDNRKFITILVLATIALMVLMYFIFVR